MKFVFLPLFANRNRSDRSRYIISYVRNRVGKRVSESERRAKGQTIYERRLRRGPRHGKSPQPPKRRLELPKKNGVGLKNVPGCWIYVTNWDGCVPISAAAMWLILFFVNTYRPLEST